MLYLYYRKVFIEFEKKRIFSQQYSWTWLKSLITYIMNDLYIIYANTKCSQESHDKYYSFWVIKWYKYNSIELL